MKKTTYYTQENIKRSNKTAAMVIGFYLMILLTSVMIFGV